MVDTKVNRLLDAAPLPDIATSPLALSGAVPPLLRDPPTGDTDADDAYDAMAAAVSFAHEIA
jgi:hypothetical protein